MAATAAVKAAVLGAGFSGRAHVDALRRVPGVEVVGLAASSERSSARAAEALGLPAVEELDALLAAADVVHNCTPNDLHLSLGTRALEAGADLLSEKPLGRTADEARALADAAAESGRVASVCLTYRYFPAIARMRQLVAEGAVGEVSAVRGVYLQDWLLEVDGPSWRRVASRSGPSCTLADLGTHLFDLARHVTGLEIERLVASLSSTLDDEDGLDDHASVLARFGGGAEGSFIVSQVAAGSKNDLRLSVDGTLGSLSWAEEDPEAVRVSRRGAPTRIEMRTPDWMASSRYQGLPVGHIEGWGDALRNLVLDFYAARAGEPDADPAPLDDGVRAAELVEHALRSATEGAWVEVSP
jgi:predicted dehydrogenase